MQGIQPQSLTDAELIHYAWLMGADKLPLDWVAEILQRLERHVDDGK